MIADVVIACKMRVTALIEGAEAAAGMRHVLLQRVKVERKWKVSQDGDK